MNQQSWRGRWNRRQNNPHSSMITCISWCGVRGPRHEESSEDRARGDRQGTRPQDDPIFEARGTTFAESAGAFDSRRANQSWQESHHESSNRLGDSGHLGSKVRGQLSDSMTRRTLLEQLAQSGGDYQTAWSDFVNRYGRRIY